MRTSSWILIILAALLIQFAVYAAWLSAYTEATWMGVHCFFAIVGAVILAVVAAVTDQNRCEQ